MIAFEAGDLRQHAGCPYRGAIQTIKIKRKPEDPFVSWNLLLEYWNMGCCGIGSFHGVGSFHSFTREELDCFFNWLDSIRGLAGYNPKEWLFSLVENQFGPLKLLVEHPNVKQIDSFMNKSHGPHRIFLFRYSSSKDFS